MADLKDIVDVRMLVLYNGRKDLLLYNGRKDLLYNNMGYSKDWNALTFRSYEVSVKERTVEVCDTYLDGMISDLEFFQNYIHISFMFFNLCKNGAAIEGFYFYNSKLKSRVEGPAQNVEYADLRLTFEGVFRSLSKSELLRGSRKSVFGV